MTLIRFSPVAVLLLVVFLLVQYQWYDTAPEGSPEFGVNFSCKRVEYFGMDCKQALAAVVDDLGVRSLRLSVYWSDVERTPGQYDWSSIDWQLDLLQQHGARAVITIGMKSQRYPEFWLPTWLRLAAKVPPDGFPEDYPPLRDHLLRYLDAATRHLSSSPAVEAFQVENEPFVHSGDQWHISRDLVAHEVAVVRAADGGAHPIVVSTSSWLRTDQTWKWILDHADILGQSVYTKWQRGPRWFYVLRYRIGPWTPNLPGQAREAQRRGKQLWITELQAEPYEKYTVDIRREPTSALRSFSLRWLRDNVTLARRSGADRVYLWGVEWWLYLREQRGDSSLWDAGRPLFGGGQAPLSRDTAPLPTPKP